MLIVLSCCASALWRSNRLQWRLISTSCDPGRRSWTCRRWCGSTSQTTDPKWSVMGMARTAATPQVRAAVPELWLWRGWRLVVRPQIALAVVAAVILFAITFAAAAGALRHVPSLQRAAI